MLSKSFEICSISKKGLTNYFLIKIKPKYLLMSEIHPKQQKKMGQVDFHKNRTSDFKNILDYNYLEPISIQNFQFTSLEKIGCVPL